MTTKKHHRQRPNPNREMMQGVVDLTKLALVTEVGLATVGMTGTAVGAILKK